MAVDIPGNAGVEDRHAVLAADEAGNAVLAVDIPVIAGDEDGHTVLTADEAGSAVLAVKSLGINFKHFVGQQIS